MKNQFVPSNDMESSFNFEMSEPYTDKEGRLVVDAIMSAKVISTYLLNGYTPEGKYIIGEEIINGKDS